MQKQHNLTLNTAQRLPKNPTSILSPQITTKAPTSTPAKGLQLKKLLDDIKQLTRVLSKQRLARVLHGHKQLRQRFPPSAYFRSEPNFNQVFLP